MAANPPYDTDPSPPSATILVVDDEEVMRTFLSSFLARKGYRVTSASSGENALELWEQMTLKPQLLITDLTMPGMSGTDLAMVLKQFQPRLKVLYITGFGFELSAEARTAIRDTPHVFLPFVPDYLLSTVKAALSQT
jgi:CheY-like chemotaxis protein